MAYYKITLSDGNVWETTVIEASSMPEATTQAEALARDWVTDPGWEAGVLAVASVDVEGPFLLADCEDEDEDEYEEVRWDVEHYHEPDEAVLVRELTSDPRYRECEHDFVADYSVVGGLKENPGIWSLGGTSLLAKTVCRHCGIIRKELNRGSQRNPYEAPWEVSFDLPIEEMAEEDELRA